MDGEGRDRDSMEGLAPSRRAREAVAARGRARVRAGCFRPQRGSRSTASSASGWCVRGPSVQPQASAPAPVPGRCRRALRPFSCSCSLHAAHSPHPSHAVHLPNTPRASSASHSPHAPHPSHAPHPWYAVFQASASCASPCREASSRPRFCGVRGHFGRLPELQRLLSASTVSASAPCPSRSSFWPWRCLTDCP